MNSLKHACRICLGDKAILDWNDEIVEFSGVSYKYCYYKYTQIEETDADCYPTNLCDKCARVIKNAHTLFEKALKSFITLQNAVNAKASKIQYVDYGDGARNIHCLKDDHKRRKTANAIINNQNKHPNNFESFKISLEQPSTDNFNIRKLFVPSINKAEKNKNKSLGSFTTALELNLQVEICSSKLLKAAAYKSSMKTLKSCSQTPLKHDQEKGLGKGSNIVDGQFIDQESSSQISPGGVELSPTKSFDKDEEILKPSNYSLSMLYTDKSDTTNSSDHFSSDCSKQLQKPLDIHMFEKDETSNNPLDTSILRHNQAEDDINSPAFLNTNSSLSQDCQLSSVIDGSIGKHNNTLTPSEISLLKQIYSKHIEIKSMKKKSKSTPKEKICQYCSLKLMGTSRLLAHEATHIEHRERNVICPKCGIKLYTQLALVEHTKTHDENRQKKHKCEFCEKAFFHKGALNVHRRIHLGLMVKCQMCSKEFYRQVDLDKHLLSHSASSLKTSSAKKAKYTVQCQYCNKAIMTNSWKAHKAAHLKQPQVKCNLCNKDFYSRTSCVVHLRRVHRKTASEYEENMHYYVDCTPRMSHLIIRQQEIVQPVIE